MILLRVSTVAWVALATIIFSGCGEKRVRAYTVAKESPPPSAAKPPPNELPPGHPPIGGGSPTQTAPEGAMPGLPPGHPPIGGTHPSALPGPSAPAASSLTWAAPDHWLAKPLGAMRRGSFTVKGNAGDADLSIIALGASANPLLANLDRWRGQLGLPRLAETQLAAETTVLENKGLRFTVVNFLGKPPGTSAEQRLLGAILYRGEEAWFFKMTGPDAVVAAEHPAFLAFLHTVQPAN